MVKSKKLEELLASLAEVRDDPTSQAGITVLNQILMYQSDAILWQRVQQAMAGGAPSP